MIRMPNSAKEVDELLSSYPTEVQKTALGARKLILATLPGALEMVDVPARVIGYGRSVSYKDMICTIILSKNGVKLGIVGGAALPNPNGLMEGPGKKHRYVVLNTPHDLKKPGLKQLIKSNGKRP